VVEHAVEKSMRKANRSRMGTATKPKTVTVGPGEEQEIAGVAAVIPVGEFQKARRNPDWLAFREAAIAEREELRKQNRSN
jgi:hypothetical protein